MTSRGAFQSQQFCDSHFKCKPVQPRLLNSERWNGAYAKYLTFLLPRVNLFDFFEKSRPNYFFPASPAKTAFLHFLKKIRNTPINYINQRQMLPEQRS